MLSVYHLRQAAEELGDAVKVLKVDTDENPRISTALKASLIALPY